MRKNIDLGPLGDTIHDRNQELKELAEIERKIADRKKTIADANQRSIEQGPHKDLACKLHSTMCRSNHTDACGWYYEIKSDVHDWTGYAHKSYLERAVKAIDIARSKNVDPTVIIDIIEAVKGY
jgi:hypothetical protein